MSKTNPVAFLEILKSYFGLKQYTLRFQKEKAYSGKRAMDGGFYLSKPGGLFRKIIREGVSDVLGRWIMDGWLRTDGRERERGAGWEQ